MGWIRLCGQGVIWNIVAANGVPYLALRFIKAYLELNQDKVQGKWICPDVGQGCAISPALFNCIIDWIIGRAMEDYSGLQVGASVHVSGLC